jgi:low temperature requirement protein LtrA
MSVSTSLFRARGSGADDRVYFAELFFDLIFVFAITQVSHSLLVEASASLRRWSRCLWAANSAAFRRREMASVIWWNPVAAHSSRDHR